MNIQRVELLYIFVVLSVLIVGCVGNQDGKNSSREDTGMVVSDTSDSLYTESSEEDRMAKDEEGGGEVEPEIDTVSHDLHMFVGQFDKVDFPYSPNDKYISASKPDNKIDSVYANKFLKQGVVYTDIGKWFWTDPLLYNGYFKTEGGDYALIYELRRVPKIHIYLDIFDRNSKYVDGLKVGYEATGDNRVKKSTVLSNSEIVMYDKQYIMKDSAIVDTSVYYIAPTGKIDEKNH